MNIKTVSRVALGIGISLLVSGAAILFMIPGRSNVAAIHGALGLALTVFYFVANKGRVGRGASGGSALGTVVEFGLSTIVGIYLVLHLVQSGSAKTLLIIVTVSITSCISLARRGYFQQFGRGMLFYGLSAAIGVLLLAALSAVNYISISKKVSWDLTKGGLFTLAEDTIRTLDGLDREVKVTAFFGPADPAIDGVKEMLERYQRRTDKLVVEFIDPEKNPQLTKEKEITAHGPRIIFSHEGVEAKAPDASEESLTNALLKVLRTGEKTIYFTTGHGEGDTADNASERGFARIAKKLEGEGLKSSTLNLTSGSVPDDAAAVAILAPQRPFFEVEVEALRTYLEGGGRLFVALEPGASDPGLEQLLEERGILFEDSLVVDPVSKLMGGGDAVPVVQQYAEHEITKSFNLMAVFPSARPVIARGDADPRPTILALSNPSAWGETEWRSGKASLDETKRRGPLGLMAVISQPADGGEEVRIVATGDADFVNNQYQSVAGNADLFLNSMNWLVSQEARITIRPKQRESSLLLLTEGDADFLNYFSISLMPMLILATGLSVWLVRRSK